MPTYNPLRCSAEIPVSPFDAVLCNALADVIFEEGARCQSCADEFGGTAITEIMVESRPLCLTKLA